MLYPQQMMPARGGVGRWNPGAAQQGGQPGGPQMVPVRGMNYLLPVNGGRPVGPAGGRGGGGGGGRGAPGGAGRGRGGPVKLQEGQQRGGGRPGQYKYTSNVRNQQIPSSAPVAAPPTPADPVPTPQDPITITALAAAPEEQKKQMLGENLFPLIKEQQPQLAGKITGMLLEMDNGELLHLLESREALNEKISEAMLVLQQHDQEEEEEEEEEES